MSGLSRIFDMVDRNPIKYDVKLPEFVGKILDLPFGYVLLLKGEAGTGKTTFAMEISNQYIKRSNIVFLSTRTNIYEFKNQYPDFSNFLGHAALKDLESVNLSEESLRLINIDSENFINVFREFEKLVVSLVKKNENEDKKRKTIIIIDSVDKLVDVIMAKNKMITKTIIFETLISLTRRLGLKLILISETSEKSSDDYLVDGIITLSRDLTKIPDRLLRVLEINKLRHISVDQIKILFSLYNGNFYAIPALKPSLTLYSINRQIKKLTKILEKNPINQAFFINLLQAKKLCLDFDTQSNAILSLMHYLFICTCLLNKISVFYVAPPDYDFVEAAKAMLDVFGEEIIQNHFRMGFYPKMEDDVLPEHVLYSQNDSIFKELEANKFAIENLRIQSSNKTVLLVLPLDHIFNNYQHQNLYKLFQYIYEKEIITYKDPLLVSQLSFPAMDPEQRRFVDSFSSRIMFYMKGLKVYKTQLFYWVKLPRPAYALYPRLGKRDQFESIDMLPIK